MLSTFIVALFLGLTNPAQTVGSEELYHVLFVQGQIMNKTSGAMLQRGDKLKATDKVVFKSKDAKAVVMSNVRGRFVMSANPSKVGSELAEVVGSIVSPLKTNSKLSTRGGEDALVSDLGEHFGSKNKATNSAPYFLVLGDSYEFTINRGALQFGDDDKIGLGYTLTNGSKGLKALAHTLENKSTINSATFNNKFPLSQMALFEFYKVNIKTKAKGEVLAQCQPIFIKAEDIKQSFKDFLAGVDADETLKSYIKGSKGLEEKFPTMSVEDKKVQLLYFFLSELYAPKTAEGELDVNAVKVDYNSLRKFIKENNL